MTTARINAITKANEPLLDYLPVWEERRGRPGVADFVFGNPQEMVIGGFASALAAATNPRDKNHYAYKFSEEESRRLVADYLTEWRGRPFQPEDIAMTSGATGAIATALDALVDIGDEVLYSDPPWFFYESSARELGATCVWCLRDLDDGLADPDAGPRRQVLHRGLHVDVYLISGERPALSAVEGEHHWYLALDSDLG